MNASRHGSRPLVVWQAGVAWDGLAGTDRHLVTALAVHVDVLWVDPPTSVVTLVRSRDVSPVPRLSGVADGVTRLHITAPPWPYRPGIDRLSGLALRSAVRATLRRGGQSADLVVGTSPHPRLDLVRDASRVYYATDDFSAGAALMGKGVRRFSRMERDRVAEADVLGAVSPEILGRWDVGGRPTFVLPNGCDTARGQAVDAAPWPDDVRLEKPVAGMVGQLSPRVDLALLEAVADGGSSLLLVGPRREGLPADRLDRLLARPNVTWVGEKPLAALAPYLRAIEVGLTPYADDDFNRASFPLKILEYLSAGRTVVATPLPAVLGLDTPWIRAERSPEAFAAAVRGALAEGLDEAAVSAKRAFAEGHDWSRRAEQFLAAVGPLLSGRAQR